MNCTKNLFIKHLENANNTIHSDFIFVIIIVVDFIKSSFMGYIFAVSHFMRFYSTLIIVCFILQISPIENVNPPPPEYIFLLVHEILLMLLLTLF